MIAELKQQIFLYACYLTPSEYYWTKSLIFFKKNDIIIEGKKLNITIHY